MPKKSFLWLWACLLAIWGGLSLPVAADTTLPPADWYAVLYTPLGQDLIWINEDGVQATIERPKVPNEKQGPQGGHDIRISPDGRYGVITAVLNDGRQSINFYDFQTGVFIKGHIAQPNETIVLGGMSMFTPTLSGFAAAFYTLGNNGVTDWRIIHFNYQTGDAVMVLQKSDNKVPDQPVGAGSFPQLMYADSSAYTFAMIPYAVGGSTSLTAFEWALQSNLVSGPHSMSSELDVNQTGQMLEAVYEVALPQFEGTFEGPIPIHNVLTQRASLEEMPQIMLSSTDGSLFAPRWISNGAGFAYRVTMPDSFYWVVRRGDEEYSFAGEPSPSDIYGTTNGYLMSFDNQTFIASTTVDPSNQPVLYEAPEDDSARIVYITPLGLPFTLSSVADVQGQPPQPQQPQQAIEADPNCAGAPKPQLVPGIPSRVSFTDGTPLRVRQQPGGTVITELAEGTEFAITEGPVCLNSYNWWKMSLDLQSGTLTGWVAEGDMEAYFVEIWYADGEGPVQGVTPSLPPAVAITPLVITTVQPPVLQITPMVITTLKVPPVAITPMIIVPGFITDGDCSNAVAQVLSVGANVITQLDGTLAMRDTPTAEFPTAQVASGVTGKITDGPLCHNGFRMWKVDFSTGQSGWVPDSFGGNLYLKKN